MAQRRHFRAREKRIDANDPVVQEKIRETAKKVKEARVEGLRTEAQLQSVLQNPDVAAMLTDMLEISSLDNNLKKYIKLTFIDKMPKRKALKEVLGVNPGYAEDLMIDSLAKDQGVRDFVEVIKAFYVSIAPVAAFKEVEVMMDPRTPAKVRLDAIKSVKQSAGVSGESGADPHALPVQIVINMPNMQNNVQINNEPLPKAVIEGQVV